MRVTGKNNDEKGFGDLSVNYYEKGRIRDIYYGHREFSKRGGIELSSQ